MIVAISIICITVCCYLIQLSCHGECLNDKHTISKNIFYVNNKSTIFANKKYEENTRIFDTIRHNKKKKYAILKEGGIDETSIREIYTNDKKQTIIEYNKLAKEHDLLCSEIIKLITKKHFHYHTYFENCVTLC